MLHMTQTLFVVTPGDRIEVHAPLPGPRDCHGELGAQA